MSPRVSIVMPCHNAERHLPVSVGSVLAQSFQDWELIAIDDGSQDGTSAWFEAQHDPRIHVIRQANQGVSAARNRGLAQCKGEYIGFLDADDTWDPEFLSTLLGELDTHPEAVLAYCGWQNLGLPGPRGQPFIPPDYEGPDKTRLLLESCRWPIHACLTRQSAIRRVGGFDPDLKIGEDFLFWMEIGQLGLIRRVPKVLAFYHHHGNAQATQDRARAALDTLKAKQKFLARYPSVAHGLDADWIENATWGRFIEQANALYWNGDIEGAQPLYKRVLRAGRGSARDKLRMLVSLLPSVLQKAIGKSRGMS
ncbi:MAG: glycosyltransferase family 2 protein [Thiobacillus sp.]